MQMACKERCEEAFRVVIGRGHAFAIGTVCYAASRPGTRSGKLNAISSSDIGHFERRLEEAFVICQRLATGSSSDTRPEPIWQAPSGSPSASAWPTHQQGNPRAVASVMAPSS